ncbi:Cytosolic non-specific dipeptidase 2 [Carabus blaptoides fortunei]
MWMNKLGIKWECFDIGWHEIDDLCYQLPQVILARTESCSKKKTLCIYSNLDVSSPKDQHWNTDPWELTEKDGKLYGKGAASGKGTLLSWFHAIHAYRRRQIDLPVNIKFIIESMNECNSKGLEEFLKQQKPTFLADICNIVIADSEWLGENYPCLIYGITGSCKFQVTAEKLENSDPEKDMDSIFATIVDSDGKIVLPHFSDHVDHITPAEEKLYDSIDFDFEEIRPTLPPNQQHWDKVQMLMNFWRLPAITVNDAEECRCENSDQNILKRNFVLKIVPKQVPDNIARLVTSHIYNVCQQINCQSKVSCELLSSSRPWLVDFTHPNYKAATRATIQVYGVEPNMIRQDNEIPIILMLQKIIDRNILLLPLGSSSCNAHSGNENITLRNLYDGTKLLIAYLYQLANNTR